MEADPAFPGRPSRAEALAELAAAEERLQRSARSLDDEATRAASALPEWSRGHVLSHLARNAEGLAKLATWAETGVETPMYGSREARARDIDAGAGRSAAALLEDLETTSARLAARFEALTPSADRAVLMLGSGARIDGWELPLVRIRELEVHHVDLDCGYTVDDWSEPFCRRTLDQVCAGFAARPEMPIGWLVTESGERWRVGPGDVSLGGPLTHLLGWLLGRWPGDDLVPSGRADVPVAPAWA